MENKETHFYGSLINKESNKTLFRKSEPFAKNMKMLFESESRARMLKVSM